MLWRRLPPKSEKSSNVLVMKKFKLFALAVLIAVLFAAGCSNKDTAVLKAKVAGADNSPIVLSLLNINKLEVVDTLTANKEGEVTFKVKLPYASPNFYYLSYNGRVIANLLLSPKDVVKVSADTLGNSCVVEGSTEAELYAQIMERINSSQKKFDSLTVELFNCEDAGDEEGVQRVRLELGKLYVQEKQSSVVKLVQNPNSFTNITLLYRQFNENLPLFASLNDGVYYMQVADSLKKLYPDSPYVKALEKEANDFGNTMEMREKLRQAEQTAFPEIKMQDVKGNVRSLSSLLGRPFVLLFWSADETSHKMLNAELEGIYKKYSASKKFEIYSICCDTDVTYWAQVVKRLPWINVCDGKGAASPSLASYNVTGIPSMFVFDSQGNIVARDVFDLQKLDSLIAGL